MQALDEQTRAARLEAAAKMGLNHDRIITDVLNNCGILRVGHVGLAIRHG